jgi:hypothetical protein
MVGTSAAMWAEKWVVYSVVCWAALKVASLVAYWAVNSAAQLVLMVVKSVASRAD